MKKIKYLIFLLFASYSSFSQVAENSYRLYLTDKNHNRFSVNNPDEFLTQKAIERRRKQGIDIHINDLPISNTYTDSLKKLGLNILSKSRWMNTVVVFTNDKDLIDTITSISFIKSKQKIASKLSLNSTNNFLEKTNLTIPPEIDPLNYGYATTQISLLNGHILHLNGYKGQGITIAVIDGGFYNVDQLPAFDSLFFNNQILGTRDFVDGDNQVFDASSHGMKVLSTMGGNIPGELVGTAPKANYWLLRSEETATEFSIEEDNWVAAAEFADSVGVDIITSSLGYTEFDDSTQNYSYSDMDGNTTFITRAADIAASKGILMLNSAGNLADDPWRYISAPADGDSVLTVGAVDEFASYAYFSGIGPTFDGRLKPNIAAMGYHTAIQGIDGFVTVANGTSFSTPIVAGMAACLWQYFPELNNMEIFKKIEESAHQYSSPDYRIGYGIPDFGKAANFTGTSINESKETVTLKVYPNPFTNYINIELLTDHKYNLSLDLYNIVGEKLIQKNILFPEFGIIKIKGLENIPAGIYMIKIKMGNQIIQQIICK